MTLQVNGPADGQPAEPRDRPHRAEHRRLATPDDLPPGPPTGPGIAAPDTLTLDALVPAAAPSSPEADTAFAGAPFTSPPFTGAPVSGTPFADVPVPAIPLPAADFPTGPPAPAAQPVPGGRRAARLRNTTTPFPDPSPTLPGPDAVLPPARRRSGPGWVDLRELDGRRPRPVRPRPPAAAPTEEHPPAQAPTRSPQPDPVDPEPVEDLPPAAVAGASAPFPAPEAHAPFRAAAPARAGTEPAEGSEDGEDPEDAVATSPHAPFRAAIPRQRPVRARPRARSRVHSHPVDATVLHAAPTTAVAGVPRPTPASPVAAPAPPPTLALPLGPAPEALPGPLPGTAPGTWAGTPLAVLAGTGSGPGPAPAGSARRPAARRERAPRPPAPTPRSPGTGTADSIGNPGGTVGGEDGPEPRRRRGTAARHIPRTAGRVSLDAAAIAAAAMESGGLYPAPEPAPPTGNRPGPEGPPRAVGPGRSAPGAPGASGAPRTPGTPRTGRAPRNGAGPQPGNAGNPENPRSPGNPRNAGNAGPQPGHPRNTGNPGNPGTPGAPAPAGRMTSPAPDRPRDVPPTGPATGRRPRSRALPVLAVVGVVLGVYGGVSLGGDSSLLPTGSDDVASAATAATPATGTGTGPATGPNGSPAPADSGPVTPTPAKSAAVPAAGAVPAGTLVVPVYWLTSAGSRSLLAREHLQVTNSGGAAASAVRAVLEQRPLDPDYSSPWLPAHTVTVQARDGAITVNLSADAFAATGVSPQTAAAAVQQLVWTVTSAAQQDAPVTILVDGAPGYRAWNAITLAGPVRRDARARASVWIDGPYEAARVTGPVHITGQGSAADRVYRWSVASDGQTIASGTVTGSAAAPSGWSQFAFDVTLAPGRYRITVSAAPGGDWQWADTRTVTVR